jgi:Nif-specific regulatory protein
MALQLVAISGKLKGIVWPIRENGLVIGRDSQCDVVVMESVVSRRHCRLAADQGGVCFKDLGSRNPALVNGRIVTQRRLQLGDEIAVGGSRFVVAGAREDQRTAATHDETSVTATWSYARPIELRTDTASKEIPAGPNTVADLVFLYEVNHELAQQGTLAGILGVLHRRLVERLRPRHLWTGLVHGKDDLVFYDAEGAMADEPGSAALEVIGEAVLKMKGVLAPNVVNGKEGKSCTFVMAVPFTLGEESIGVVALETETPHGAYSEEDLRLLVLMAQSVAPIIHSAETLEQLRRDNDQLRAKAGESMTFVGESRAIRHVRSLIGRAARSNLNVLITGETGTGKEIVARLVHKASAKRSEPFIVVNCAAIPRDLFESELFGYEKGAFTGAAQSYEGLLSQAHGGTLFLDEIGDLTLENQARILRAVEQGTFRRIGAAKETSVKIRVIAATNKDLSAAIRQGSFREDLYQRLAGFEIYVPPLRARPSDVPLLVEHFLVLAKDQAKHPVKGISPKAMKVLQSHVWRGNVRELRASILRALFTTRKETLQPEDFLDVSGKSGVSEEGPPALSLTEMEKQHISTVLRQCGGSIRLAAGILGIARSTLYLKIAEHDIK